MFQLVISLEFVFLVGEANVFYVYGWAGVAIRAGLGVRLTLTYLKGG